MNKRSSSPNNSKNAKRMKVANKSNDNSVKIKFTPSDFLRQKIILGDKHVSLIAYVESLDDIINITSKGDNKQHEIFKFILNNNDGCRIQCNIWNTNINMFKNQIRMNEILLVQNVRAQDKSNFNSGNMDFELHLNKLSTVKKLGDFNLKETIENLKVVSFNTIKTENGYIKTEGFVRNEFINTNESRPNEFYGAITDGMYNLGLTILNYKNNCKQGIKIRVIGEIEELETGILHLNVRNSESVEILEETMELHELILGGEALTRH